MWVLSCEVQTCLLAGGLILAFASQNLGVSFGWVFRSHGRMDRDAQLGVALKVARLVCVVGCLALGGQLPGLVLAYGVAGSLCVATGLAMYRRLNLPPLSTSMPTARMLIREGRPLFAMSLAIAIEQLLNTNILYKLTSSSVIGWCGVAWTIAGMLIAPATLLASVMDSARSSAAGNSVLIKRSLDDSFRPLLLIAVLASVGTDLFADVPIGIVYG
jgi:O-antigen/teichoic acid export membrane protein